MTSAGWVFTIARRRAIDRARREARRPRVAPLGDVDVIDHASSVVSLGETAVELAVAVDLLDLLTPDERKVVTLRVVADMTVGETARIVGKSEVAVLVLCDRGLRALAQHLAGNAEDVDVPA